MRQTIFGCLGAAAVAFALQFTPADAQASLFSACDPCGEVACNPCDDTWDCDPCAPNGCAPIKAGKWFLNGHIEAGFFANGHGNVARYDGGPGTVLTYGPGMTTGGRAYNAGTGNSGFLQNTRLTGGQINQVYISMGKAVDGRRGLDIGGTVDFTWGSDAYLVQARGMEFGAGHGGPDTLGRWGEGDYFAAFAQAYVEAAYGRWNFIAGKFYAPFGIDSYKSTDNFFYSWSPTMTIAPHVGGGAYAMYKASDRLTVIGGWVMPEELGESSKNNLVLGGIIWQPGKRLNVRYAFAAGENTYENGPFAPAGAEIFVHSLKTTAQLNKRLQYIFDWTLLNVNTKNNQSRLASYALMNEVIYQANKKWAFGTRFGVLNHNSYGADADWYTVSLGANWTPNKWLTVKPEVRYDWTDGKVNAPKLFNSGENTYQVSGGLSAVVKF